MVGPSQGEMVGEERPRRPPYSRKSDWRESQRHLKFVSPMKSTPTCAPMYVSPFST
mgnify:CR=1 FL=1